MKNIRPIVWCLSGGLLGALSVLAGELFQISGFCASDGYWGVGFLDSTLYAIGTTSVGLIIVGGVWALYGALIGLLACLAVQWIFLDYRLE